MFNQEFLKSLVGIIEHNSETEEEDNIAEQATSLLLAFNLHFPKNKSNIWKYEFPVKQNNPTELASYLF